MSRVSPIAVAILLTACRPTGLTTTTCTSIADCAASEHCSKEKDASQGVCMTGAQPCDTNQSCPDGEHCCDGFCAQIFCCKADLECPDGYCDDNTCRDGGRATCSETEPCATGRCLVTFGECVECIYNDDCEESAGLVCSTDHHCVPEGAGCSVASCAAQGLICAPEQGDCRPCISTSECGDQVCNGGTCQPCTLDAECGTGRVCQGGNCINDAGTACTSNVDCGDQFCNLSTSRCEPCLITSECGTGRTCSSGSCIATSADCTADSACAPPLTVCVSGLCEAGCSAGSCAPGQVCSPTTGRCSVTSTGTLVLGAACSAHTTCLSNACWPIVNLQTETIEAIVCSDACMRHDDCPAGFVCFELGDSNLCLDKATFFPTLPLNVPPGGSCSTDVLDFVNGDCATGYCNTDSGQCSEMCGRDADCAYLPGDLICLSAREVWGDRNNDGVLDLGYTQLCYPPLQPTQSISEVYGVDELCLADENDMCEGGFCAQTPNLPLSPRCAQPCCTPSDCAPSRSICKPIDVWDGIRDLMTQPFGFQKICLGREYQGLKQVGELCGLDAECRSEICVAGPSGEKRCTHTCCTSRDCADYDWASACRPPFNQPPVTASHPLVDANFDAIAASLGRTAITLNGIGTAEAWTTLCMPR